MLSRLIHNFCFMFSGSTRCHRCIFIWCCLCFCIWSYTVNNRFISKSGNIFLISICVRWLGNTTQEAESIRTFFQSHMIGFCRDWHHIDHILIKSGGFKLFSNLICYCLVRTDYHNRCVAKFTVTTVLNIQHINRFSYRTEDWMIKTCGFISDTEKS